MKFRRSSNKYPKSRQPIKALLHLLYFFYSLEKAQFSSKIYYTNLEFKGKNEIITKIIENMKFLRENHDSYLDFTNLEVNLYKILEFTGKG